MFKIKKVNIVGLGKAWLPLAAHIAKKWFDVIGIDVDSKKVDMINSGQNPIPEENGLDELIKKFWWSKLLATTDWDQTRQWNVFIVIVPLFVDQYNLPDFSIVDNVTEQIWKHLKKWDLVVFETTFPPTTTDTRLNGILESQSGLKEGEDFFLAYSPERIMTGVSLDRFENFPKVIGGISKISGDVAYEVYSQFIPNLFKVEDAKTAEFIKVIEWVYRDANIALANELYKVAQELGIDFYQAREYANHEYCHIHLPSVGVGGHCVPVYPHFLIKLMEAKNKEGYRVLMQTARDINEDMVNWRAEKIVLKALEVSKPLKDVEILIKGITYRPWVKELYHSRSLALAKLLKEKWLKVKVYDEMFSPQEIEELGFEYGEKGEVEFNSFRLEILVNNW